MSVDNCFQYIIGLSTTTCDCLEDARPDDYNISKSDIFLDELINLKVVDASKDCNRSNLWELMENARAQAVDNFASDLMAFIAQRSKLSRLPYKGPVSGYKKSATSHPLLKPQHGMKVNFGRISGGFATIKRIGLGFNMDSALDIVIYSNQQDTPLATLNALPTIANNINWFTLNTPIELEMLGNYNKDVQLNFLFQPPTGLRALDVKMNCYCGTGFHPFYDLSRPTYYSNTPKGNYGFADYLMAGGTSGSDLDTVENWGTTNTTNGLLLDVSLGCKVNKTICDGELDFIMNPFAKVMAYAVRFKAAAILIDWILKSANINRYTLMDGAQLGKQKEDFLKEYNDRVQKYLAVEMTKSNNINMNSDCFSCLDLTGMSKKPLYN